MHARLSFLQRIPVVFIYVLIFCFFYDSSFQDWLCCNCSKINTIAIAIVWMDPANRQSSIAYLCLYMTRRSWINCVHLPISTVWLSARRAMCVVSKADRFPTFWPRLAQHSDTVRWLGMCRYVSPHSARYDRSTHENTTGTGVHRCARLINAQYLQPKRHNAEMVPRINFSSTRCTWHVYSAEQSFISDEY